MNDSPTSSLIVCVCVHLYVRTCCGSRCNTPIDVTTNCSVPTYLPTLLHAHFPYSSNLEDTSGGGEGGGIVGWTNDETHVSALLNRRTGLFLFPSRCVRGTAWGHAWEELAAFRPSHLQVFILLLLFLLLFLLLQEPHLHPIPRLMRPRVEALQPRAGDFFFFFFCRNVEAGVCVCPAFSLPPPPPPSSLPPPLLSICTCMRYRTGAARVVVVAFCILLLPPPSERGPASKRKKKAVCIVRYTQSLLGPGMGATTAWDPQMMMSPSFCFCLFQLFFLSPFVAVSPFFAPPRLFSVAPPSSPPSFFSFFRP